MLTQATEYILHADPSYVEWQYEQYKADPASVTEDWRRFFEGFEYALRYGNGKGVEAVAQAGLDAGIDVEGELKVFRYIQAFRFRGHLIADTNPIRKRKDRKPHLDLEDFGLSEADLDRSFYVGKELGMPGATLREIMERLRRVWAGSIGLEWEYIRDPEEYQWLLQKMEVEYERYQLTREEKLDILNKISETTLFEEFLGKKYPGEKRFSLEGSEAAIPALEFIIREAVDRGIEEIAIGMAHRGRLNVLANLLNKTYKQIFSEFEGESPRDLTMGDGDVKYHMGYSSMKYSKDGKRYYIKVAPNPSHLESVDPVVLGFVRGKDDVVYHSQGTKIMPILVHGDAAIAGQGVVYETLQLSSLEGYQVGGTVHLVINNQIGFTTDFDEARSSDYCTSVASVIRAPVFHVNGDDVEAVVFVARLAAEWRQRFHRDVFIDMVAYRKHGHNEADDPKYTQPLLYKLIAKHPGVRQIYLDKLLAEGVITREEFEKYEREFWSQLQDKLRQIKEQPLPYTYQEPELAWKKLRPPRAEDFRQSPPTGVRREVLDHIVRHITAIPEGFKPLPKLVRQFNRAATHYFDEGRVDWATAELLAYGSIMMEGKNVRLSGQDSRRGTFAHRHGVIYDIENNAPHNRLDGLAENAGKFYIYNSPLSEFSVVGFDYGYSLTSPNHLVLWEAQFGDFANGAQVIFDQYVSSAYSKWHRMSGLVLLLPHGYEGQGPEHSSARLERWLQLCAELNMCVINPTTPANFFHALRRQLAWPFRIPLVVMAPKSLLRHPEVVSPVEQLVEGRFEEVLWDEDIDSDDDVERVLCCSGKVYYDLLEYKRAKGLRSVAIIRFEQLYPFPMEAWQRMRARFKKAEVVWVQEEPENMGAYTYLLRILRGETFGLVSRPESASTATAFKRVHLQEREQIIRKAFDLDE